MSMMIHATIFSLSIGCGLASIGFAQETAAAPRPAPTPFDYFVYIAGSPKAQPNAIYRYRFTLATGNLVPDGVAAEVADANFLAFSPDHKHLYASVNITNAATHKIEGGLEAFAVDPRNGDLTALGAQPSAGLRAVHVALDPSGRTALVANYQGNTVAALAIQPDGRLAPPTAAGIQTHTGSGPNPTRQQHPYPHSFYSDPTGRFAFSCDLGTDQLFCYTLDAEHATLTPSTPPTVSLPPGSGPRHLTFSHDARFLYVLTEMGNSLVTFDYTAATGTLRQLQVQSSLPPAVTDHDKQKGAEIQLHPNGKFLYVSNRGPHSSIALFSLDPQTGLPTFIADEPSGGADPRYFGLDPTGTFLFAANQTTGNVVLFRIDPATGRLTLAAAAPTLIAQPMCVAFLPSERR